MGEWYPAAAAGVNPTRLRSRPPPRRIILSPVNSQLARQEGIAMSESAAAPRLLAADRIYGAIALAAILLAIWFLLRGGPGDSGADSRPPSITIVDPRPGAELAQPVTVLFETRAPLRADGADSTSNRHLHLDVGGTMLMPGPADVRRVRGGLYRWTLPPVPPGPATLRAYWSDAAHRAIAGAPGDSVQVRIR
jgi:hypothetical protein